MAFGGRDLPQSCRLCAPTLPEGPANRAAWGCDQDSAELQFAIVCPFCDGQATSCTDCKGAGQLEYHRCPFSQTEPVHWAIVRAVGMMDTGLLPGGGGWAEQPATFVEAAALVRKVRNQLEAKRRERERQRNKAKR